jgi:hypothetical protein
MKKRRKDKLRIINVTEPTEEDEYLGRVDAMMTRKALRLAKKRKLVYVA